MKSILIEQDDQGVITVAVDGGEPMPVEGAEGACEIVEGVLGGETETENEGEGGEMPMSEEDFAGGFNAVRQGGINGRGM